MLDFGAALRVLKNGGAVTRAAWNDRSTYIRVDKERIVMYSGNYHGCTPLWRPSVSDVLSTDWQVVA